MDRKYSPTRMTKNDRLHTRSAESGMRNRVKDYYCEGNLFSSNILLTPNNDSYHQTDGRYINNEVQSSERKSRKTIDAQKSLEIISKHLSPPQVNKTTPKRSPDKLQTESMFKKKFDDKSIFITRKRLYSDTTKDQSDYIEDAETPSISPSCSKSPATREVVCSKTLFSNRLSLPAMWLQSDRSKTSKDKKDVEKVAGRCYATVNELYSRRVSLVSDSKQRYEFTSDVKGNIWEVTPDITSVRSELSPPDASIYANVDRTPKFVHKSERRKRPYIPDSDSSEPKENHSSKRFESNVNEYDKNKYKSVCDKSPIHSAETTPDFRPSKRSSLVVYDEYSSDEESIQNNSSSVKQDSSCLEPNEIHSSKKFKLDAQNKHDQNKHKSMYSPKDSTETSDFCPRKRSSIVVYDECSSDEENLWNNSYTAKQNSSPHSRNTSLNLNSPDTSFISGYLNKYFSETDSSSEDNETPLNKLSPKKKAINEMINDYYLYTFPRNLDYIYEKIDVRLIGKHDEWVHGGPKKVLILGDSHTRFLVNGMKEIFPALKIYTFCKPSAKTEQVFSGLEKSINELTHKDFLILICGTNDMWDTSIEPAEMMLARKLRNLNHTNVIVCNVPRNYSESDSSYVQQNISKFNRFLKKTVKKIRNAYLVNLHKLKEKRFFTKHGLHFNGCGKVKICELLSHKLVDVLDLINS